MATTYDLVFRMAADVARLQADMNEAKSIFSRSVRDIERTVGRFKQLLLGIFAGVSVGSIVASFKSLTQQAIESADAIGDMAQKAGVSGEFLSSLQLAADVSGTSVDGLTQGLRVLNQSLFEAASGAGDKADAFKLLGIDVRDASGNVRDAESVFLELADRISEVGDQAAKVGIARTLGKGFNELLPMLNLGSEGLRSLMDTARALGLVLDSETIASADRLNDTFTVLSKTSQGLGNRIMRELAPALEGIAASLLDAAKNTSAFDNVARGVSVTFKALVTGGELVRQFFVQLGTILGGIAAGIKVMFESGFRAGIDAMRMGFADAESSAAGFRKFVDDLWNDKLPKLDNSAIAVAKSMRRLNVESEDATKAANKQREAFERLIAQFSSYTSQIESAASLGRELTQAERIYLRALEDHERGVLRLTEAQLKQLAVSAYAAIELDRKSLAQKELNRLLDEYQKQSDRSIEAAIKQNEAIAKEIEAAKRSNEEIGLTRDELAALEVSRLNDAAATTQQTAAMLAQAGESEKLIEQYLDMADRLRELAKLRQEGAVKRSEAEAIEETRKKWQKAAGDIESALTQALVQGFQSGKNFAQSVGDYIVNYFRSTVARIIAESIIGALKSVMGGIASGGSGVSSIIGSLIGGFFAERGPVRPDRAYVVGERGPELFVPRTAGTIVPNGVAAGEKYEFHWHIGQIGSGVSRQDLVAAMSQTERATIARIQDLRGRNRID